MLDRSFHLTNKSHYPADKCQGIQLHTLADRGRLSVCGKKIARKGKGKFPAGPKDCSQANYPADKYQGTQLHSLADRDSSSGPRYPTFKQLEPGR